MKNSIIPDYEFSPDAHEIVENADFSTLDNMYAGRTAYYGDFHVHSATGGTSDGRSTPEQWLAGMKELKMDFVGLMDHRQIRHMYLDSFDPEYFLYGTEPAGMFKDHEGEFHYLMIFTDREGLTRVLERFPDVFNFTGGIEGHFDYRRVEKSRFLEVVKAVYEEGGAFVHAHPKQCMKSDRTEDFYFGDGTVIEIIYYYTHKENPNPDTIDNYTLWMKMLDAGYKVYNSGCCDSHTTPSNSGVSTVYSDKKQGPSYVKKLRCGDFNSGFIGIKMCLGDAAVGQTVKYEDGLELKIKIDDTHPLLFNSSDKYYINIITDKGLAYTSTLTVPFSLSLKVKPRKFYRAEIVRENDLCPAAIGNPIWLKK